MRRKYDDLIQEELAYWKDILGLTDWDVEFTVDDGMGDDVEASVVVIYERRWAKVTIASPERLQQIYGQAARGIREAVVHELVHIVLWPWGPSGESEIEKMLFEQTVDRLSMALVRLRDNH